MATNNETLNVVLQEIRDVRRISEENSKTLNGTAGQPGLVGLYIESCAKITSIEKVLSNDIAHLSAKVDVMFAAHVDKDKAVEEITKVFTAKIEALEKANHVTWADVLKEWVKPVIVAVVTAAVVYLVVTNYIAVK